MATTTNPAAVTPATRQPKSDTKQKQFISFRLVHSQRRLLDSLDSKYGQGNYEVKGSIFICSLVDFRQTM